jgi:hypothetical protein
MLSAAPGLRAVAVLGELMRRHPDLGPSVRRTLERRIREWKALHGPDKEVIFRQTHEPGRMALSDFTHLDDLGVAVAGVPLVHMAYHFRAPWSGFEHVHIVLGGESFVALSEGLQNALASFGGAPKTHRTDSLSAAFRNLTAADQKDITTRYASLCADYGMTPTRNNRGFAHENGSIESSHGHLKASLRDTLLLRGSSDFPDLDSYRAFVDGIIERKNRRNRVRIEQERLTLNPLPAHRTPDFEEAIVTVGPTSGFTLRKSFYTVPSRLIGTKLRAKIREDRIELFLGGSCVAVLARAHRHDQRHVIDYRHVIHTLKAKPGAMMRLVYRDQLFPREAYRRMFHHLVDTVSERAACKVMVELLAMAHERACEADLAAILEQDLAAGRSPDMPTIRVLFAPAAPSFPRVGVVLPQLTAYDSLIGEAA